MLFFLRSGPLLDYWSLLYSCICFSWWYLCWCSSIPCREKKG